MGRRGVVVRAVDFGLRDPDSLLSWCGAVLLGKALHLHVHSLDPGVNGYLVGQRRLACVIEQFSAPKMAAETVCSQGS